MRSVLAWSLVARLPLGTTALALLFLMRSRGLGYGAAGAVAAAYTVAAAAGAPVAGRAVDRRGATAVLLPRTAAYALALVGTWAAAVLDAPIVLVAALAALAGATLPPVAASIRTLWPALVTGPDLRATAFALEAALQELFFLTGPLVVAALAALGAPSAAVLAAAAAGTVGTLGFATRDPVRGRGAATASPTSGRRLGALAAPGVRMIVAASCCAGVAFGAVEVAMPAFGEEHGTRAIGGALVACFSAGSLVGGLVAGRWGAGDPRLRLRAATALLAAALVPTLVAPGVPVMGALILVAGVPIAPAFAAAYALIDELAPPGTVAEAFAWVGTAVPGGIAAGTAAGGVLTEWRGADAPLVLAVAAAALTSVVVRVRANALAPG